MAVKKIRFMASNYFDTATVTASSAAVGYPVTQLQNRWKTVGWRSTGITAEEVIANLGSPKAIYVLIVENMSLTTGATVELGGHAADPTGLAHTTYELIIPITTAMVTAKRIVVFLAAPETYQWWRLLITDVAGTYLEAGRVYLGPYFEPGRSYRTQWTRTPASDSVVSYSDGGQASVSERPIYWTYDLPISIVGTADEAAYAVINTNCGIKTPLWICLDSSDEITRTVYGHFLEYIAFQSVIDGSMWDTSLKFREEL